MTSNLPETPENHEDSSEDEPLFQLTAQEFAERFSNVPELGKKNKKKTWLPFAPEWIGVDWVVFNTHVGMGIRNGGLTWILKNWFPDIVLMQEVKNVDLSEHSKQFHVLRYGMNAILARKTKFILVESGGPDIRFGGQYVRTQAHSILLHRELRRVFYVQGVHIDPLHGKFDLSEVRDEARLRSHILQGNAHIDWQRKHIEARGAIHADGGDYNELINIKHLDKKPYFKMMSMAFKYARMGMYPSAQLAKKARGLARIDDIFFKTEWYLEVVSRDSVNLRNKFKGIDHNTLRVRTLIRPKRKWSKAAQSMMSNLP